MTTRPTRCSSCSRARPVFAISVAASALFALGGSTSAMAGGATADEREAQRSELYREATKAAGAGHWTEAKERLRAVLAIRSSPKVLFSLAQVEEQLGQLASAQADYARSREGGATEGKGDVVQAAELAERALGPRVPHLRLVLSGGGPAAPDASASAASATLDEQPIIAGALVAVDPGEHRLLVRARGMRTATLNLRIEEGQQVDRLVSLVPEEGAPPPALSSPPPEVAPPARAARVESPASAASPMRTTGLVVLGVGVIALGVGAVFGLESLSKHEDAQKACPGATCSTASGAGLWHDAVTSGNASNVAFLVGGVGLVAGAILWLAAPRSSGGATRVGLGPGSIRLEGGW